MAALATLRIYRPADPLGAWLTTIVEVDGREVGRLRNARELVTQVEPGRRSLRLRLGDLDAALELALAPGEYVRLEARVEATPARRNRRRRMKGDAWLELVRVDGAAVPPEGLAGPLLDAKVLGITETHRSEEPFGTDTRRIDNASGAARLTRTMRATREWNHTVSLGLNASSNITAEARLGPNWLALRTSLEQNLERAYSVSAGRREEFVEEIGIEVEPGADVTVVLTWKRLWQHGVIRALFDGLQVEVPFQVAIGVTFDQSLR